MCPLRLKSVLGAIALTGLLTGCRTSPPYYEPRPLTPQELTWHDTVSSWYPGWGAGNSPEYPRTLPDANRMSPRAGDEHAVPTATRPAAIVVPPPPYVQRETAPKPAAPPPSPIIQPVYDFPGATSPPAGLEPFKVLPPGASPKGASSGISKPEWYSIQKGDTLASIAKRFYGTSGAWRQIHEANRKAIPTPEKLTVGTRIRLP